MRNIILIFATMILLSGCHPYRVDVLQGNILDKNIVSQLHLGMHKAEVEALLGTPILTDAFDPDTWLYAYTKQINGGKLEKQRIVLKFKSDKLVLLQ